MRVQPAVRTWLFFHVVTTFSLWIQATCAQSSTARLLPAAQLEYYNDDSSSELVGVLDPSLEFHTEGCPDNLALMLKSAIQRFRDSLHKIPDFANSYPVNPSGKQLFRIGVLQLRVESAETNLSGDVDESYALSMDQDSGLIAVSAPTIFGALHALTSFRQLVEFGWLGTTNTPIYTLPVLSFRIDDRPAYSFRGLLIDTARHFLPLSLILSNLDVMSMNKLNVLHWHMTDDTSFPYESASLPELAREGAYHPQLIYTNSDVKRVIHEAHLRGIRVIPEIDMPGHTQSVGRSHPELMTNCSSVHQWNSHPMDPTNDLVYDFVRTVYQDLKDLFPAPEVHVGGDEVNLGCWNSSQQVQTWMKKHNITDPTLVYEEFETKLLTIVNDLDKTPIVWQEVFNLNLTISDSTIVDVWKGFDVQTIQNATRQGYRVVLSGCWYLDHLDQTWDKLYKCDPRNFTGDTELMLGGHASMWGERVDASNFMSRIWPRASATAERLWTGDVSKASKNIADRIRRFRCHLVEQGFDAGPVGPGVCPHEVPYRKNSCEMAGSRLQAEVHSSLRLTQS